MGRSSVSSTTMEVNNFDGCINTSRSIGYSFTFDCVNLFSIWWTFCPSYIYLSRFIYQGVIYVMSRKHAYVCSAKVMHHLLHKPRAYGVDSTCSSTISSWLEQQQAVADISAIELGWPQLTLLQVRIPERYGLQRSPLYSSKAKNLLIYLQTIKCSIREILI